MTCVWQPGLSAVQVLIADEELQDPFASDLPCLGHFFNGIGTKQVFKWRMMSNPSSVADLNTHTHKREKRKLETMCKWSAAPGNHIE